LIEARQHEHGILLEPGTDEIGHCQTIGKRLVAVVRDADQFNGGLVGYSRLVHGNELLDFHVGDPQLPKLFDAVEIHARLIEGLGVGTALQPAAAEASQQGGDEDDQRFAHTPNTRAELRGMAHNVNCSRRPRTPRHRVPREALFVRSGTDGDPQIACAGR
jgi:hypothetical protein